MVALSSFSLVLHCNGEMKEMLDIAGALPSFGEKAYERAKNAARCWSFEDGSDEHLLREEFHALTQLSHYEPDPTETAF